MLSGTRPGSSSGSSGLKELAVIPFRTTKLVADGRASRRDRAREHRLGAAQLRALELGRRGGVAPGRRAPDIVFYEIPEAADTGVFRGADAFAAHVRGLLELGGHFQIELRSIEGCGAYVLAAVEQNFEGRTGGVAMAGRTFHLARWEGGRVCELHSFLDADQARREYEQLTTAGD